MSTNSPLPVPQFRVALKGDAILTSPQWNKGTAFTVEERKALGLTGRLPFRVNTLEEQCERAYDQLESREEPLRKNTFLQSLKDQNWVLYYALLSRHLTELIPIIYTPTEVCGASSGLICVGSQILNKNLGRGDIKLFSPVPQERGPLPYPPAPGLDGRRLLRGNPRTPN